MEQFLEFASANTLLMVALMASFFAAVFNELRLRAQGVSAIDPTAAVALINGGAKVIDLRKAEDYDARHIIDADNVPADSVGDEKTVKAGKKGVLLVCDSGLTSGRAATALRKAGNEKVFALKGGMLGWQQANLPVVGKDA